MIVPSRGADGFCHPASEEEISSLIRFAREKKLPVRVRGSAHSVARAIYTDHRLEHRPLEAIDIMFDRYAGIEIEGRRVTVRAGARFGFDPRDPTGRSTETNGLCSKLDAAGLALPILGGVSHQTVSGFFATGSEGGSLTQSLQEQLVAITLIDGRGEIHRLDRGSDLFHAAATSLGCFGIVSSMTLDCVDRFDLVGEERISRLRDAEIDLFSDGPRGLAAFLQRESYARVLWWPQPGVDKLVVWKAARAEPSPEKTAAYQAFPKLFGSHVPMQAAAGWALRAIGSRPSRLLEHMPFRARRAIEWSLARVYDTFVPNSGDAPQRFRDSWHRAIPLDDQIEERFMPVRFTEILVDVAQGAELMCRLRNLFAELGYRAANNFVCEIYGAKRSDLWMSPSYGRDSVRINVFWLEHNDGDPIRDVFPRFWAIARDLDSRLHWGKVLDPEDPDLIRRYPRHRDFLALRERFDPDGLFLTDYWRSHLGLETPRTFEPAHVPDPPLRPLFALRPTDLGFADRAKSKFQVEFETTADPGAVFRIFTSQIHPELWMQNIAEYRELTGPFDGVGTVADEDFSFMTVRVRTIVAEPGRRWSASVDAISLPLAEEMLQDLVLTSTAGGTSVVWTIYFDPLRKVAKFEPLVRPLFSKLFENIARDAKRHLEGAS